MTNWLSGAGFLAGTILLTVYGQIVFKWQGDKLSEFPDHFSDRLLYIFKLLINPWIFSSFGAAFLASLLWLGALRQMDLSVAYPFMSLSFVLVMFTSAVLLGEALTLTKVLGAFIIVLGLVISVR
jgi:drug/metabolite transporter (DMT)-like permease